MSSFSDPAEVASYAERVARHVPGLRDLHRMVGLLLAECVPADGRILVVGAGGGLELKALAEMQQGWRFDGVDPSPQMLALARSTLGELAARVTFHEGYIDDAPEGLFDGATCLLTLHFLPRDERIRTLKEIHRRLKPGGRLVTVHHSFPNDDLGKDKWLGRNAALVSTGGIDPISVAGNIKIMKEKLPVLSPDQDVAVLENAGFGDVELFYAAFTFKGWVSERC
ncbi:tRNA (cmo5U34)-methyltransferase [Azospirillum lipoferum]|uniref:Class I SAM-dependent methyltransferase n=1 Tax=Azospirillum lipoferum TaxID=193 RepID=A0A5A9GKR2_AZOLI|nr:MULTISPECIES: class I SAM-dependent methyltransferase [Azospirillum]KAA0594917.1 class I SAM-dependent methyltransferase [Azospirillum lipoferum]MCP1612752.1 tRNA (cmo5U34)-methyltransferase [Azospirillum lipoferum]MDW5532110.1 class I SAM-dependent methyltransferase [Azospirillum sp. NL1]